MYLCVERTLRHLDYPRLGRPENGLTKQYLSGGTWKAICHSAASPEASAAPYTNTGLWKDVGRLKGPILRGLPSRPPYFHNGSASSLSDVIDFYNRRFNIGFTDQEKTDLIAFLNSL
jgi:hypothetical protein